MIKLFERKGCMEFSSKLLNQVMELPMITISTDVVSMILSVLLEADRRF